MVVCISVELILQLADFGFLGPERLRLLAYSFGGFWPGLLRDWQPNFGGQPFVMFVTYTFFHGGIVHLFVNMVTLFSMGPAVQARVGSWGYFWVFSMSAIGGAVFFGIFAADLLPMVGASGALFGLVGAWITWDAIERRTHRLSMWPVLRTIGLFLVLNLVLWWAMAGQLAWQTHLGGFLVGSATAFWFRDVDV